jgi:predicted membrane chloride channel (bestrophin family)
LDSTKNAFSFSELSMETDLNTLLTSVGGCDRIKTTPIPFAYFAHIRSSISTPIASIPMNAKLINVVASTVNHPRLSTRLIVSDGLQYLRLRL